MNAILRVRLGRDKKKCQHETRNDCISWGLNRLDYETQFIFHYSFHRMSENDKDTLAFWLEFEFENFEQWTPPTTTTTSTMPIHASGGPILTSTTKSTTTTTLSQTEIHQRFCYSQPLAFCSNCEPMCTIQTNCLVYDICYTNLPFDTLYWTPLIKTCCGVCNFVCDITTWHPFFVGPLEPTTTTTTLELPTPPLNEPRPVTTYPDYNTTLDTISTTSKSTTSTSTTSTSTTTKSTTISSTTHKPLDEDAKPIETYPEHTTTLAATPTTAKSTTSTSTTKTRTVQEIPTTGDNISVMITSEPIEIGKSNLIGTTKVITSVVTERTSNNRSKVSDEGSTPRDSKLLTIIAPCVGVIVLGLIVYIIAYKKLKKGQSSLKSKNSSSNSMTETPPTISARVEEVDITDVAITELWERIKNDDNYGSKLARPGTFHRAPLASVLNPDTSDF